MEPNGVFGLINIGSALLIIAVSIPLIMRKVKMNYFYGIRIKKSFESEENWYAINAYGGKQLVIWSIPMLLAGALCFFIPITYRNKDVMSFVLGVVPISVCIAIAVIRILVYAKRV